MPESRGLGDVYKRQNHFCPVSCIGQQRNGHISTVLSHTWRLCWTTETDLLVLCCRSSRLAFLSRRGVFARERGEQRLNVIQATLLQLNLRLAHLCRLGYIQNWGTNTVLPPFVPGALVLAWLHPELGHQHCAASICGWRTCVGLATSRTGAPTLCCLHLWLALFSCLVLS